MKREFHYHPSRQGEVDKLIQVGTLKPWQAIPSVYMPIEDGDGNPTVGWWIEVWELKDFVFGKLAAWALFAFLLVPHRQPPVSHHHGTPLPKHHRGAHTP